MPSLTRCLASALAAAAFLSAPARAAQQIRSAHTASLLPTGDILLAGGVDNTGAVLASAELIRTSQGGTNNFMTLPSMNVARASATATVMATGMVLVAGGIDGAGNARADAEIYDPASNSWTCVPAGCPNTGMTNPRYDHTATLLFTGKVLLCGGQNLAGTVWSSCDLFTPSALPAIGGSFSATGSLQQARALHTATLLKNGKVWIAGGWNPAAAATNGWLPTTERYDPVAGTFSSAQPLSSARGLHTATMMGSGKVLVAGGYNGANVLANFGILDSLEIYDPVSNSVLPASPMSSRREMQAATLAADGVVELFGGLGNVTTTYLSNPAWTTLSQTQTIADVFSGQLSTGNVTTAVATIPKASFLLGTPALGHIQNGEVLFSSPSISFTGGIVYFPPTAPPDNPAVGLRASLNGAVVDCQTPFGPPQNNCGYIKTALTVTNLNQGQVFFSPLVGSISGNAAVDGLNDTFINFSPSPLGTSVTGTLLPGSSIYANITINFPAAVAGATISSGTITVTGGTVTQPSTYTITLTAGYANVPPGTVVGTGGATTINTYFSGLQGPIAGLGSNPTSGQPMPEPNSKASLSLTGIVNYVATSVNVGGLPLTVDIATVVIRGMVFGNPEYYNPAANQTSITPPSVGGVSLISGSPDDASFGPTSTLLPNNDRYRMGGSDCFGATCASFTAKSLLGLGVSGWRSSLLTLNKAFGAGASLSTARALHTATLLSNGTILVAGGTNGLNVLPTAELFDPVAGAFSPTNGPMSVVRDLHTASLLPNGRVLLAGGFTTNATSTGSTNAVDIYYPDTKLFLPTSVMLSSRSNHTATSMADGSVLVVGGYGAADVITASAEVYYATSAAWTPVAPLAGGGTCDAGSAGHPERALHSATLLKDGRLLVAGGINSQGVLSSVCAYSPATNAWTLLASLPHQLRSHSATLLPDGRVLVAGGDDGFGEFNGSFIYDPALNSWSATSATAPLLQPRFGHSATLLPNATVMISGGVNRFGTVANEVELFHVNGSSWVSGGNRFSQGARAFHTMTLAPNGQVYAIGGGNGVIGGSGTSLYSASEQSYFTFSPDAFTPGAPPSLRQSTIAATSPNPVAAGLAAFNVTGLQLRGGTEASGGGAASANSSFSYPRLALQSLGGSGGGASQGDPGFLVDLTTQVYLNNANLATLDTSLTVALPALTSPGVSNGLPRGWYNVRTGANDVYANGAFVQIGPAKPAAAPATSSGTVVGASSITWTWSAVAGVDGYDVYQATSLVFLGTAAATASPYFYQTSLAPNTTASVAIAGYTASGDGPLLFSSTYFTLANPPSQVQVASVSFNSLLLEWNPNGNIQGALYEVSQSTDWPSPFSASVSTPVPASAGLTASSVLIPNLLANTTYSFRVRTFNAALAPSAFSVTVSTLTRTPVAGVTGAALDQATVQWNWINPGGVIYFNVYNATSGVVVATPTASTYNDVGLGTNTPRAIMVSAVTAAGEGPLTPGPTVYTLAAAPGPVFPFLTFVSTGGFAAAWTANGNPPGTSYQAIDTAYVPNPNNNKLVPAVISTVTTIGLSAGFTGLTPAQYATVNVVALNGNGIASGALTGSTYTFANAPANPLVTNTTPVSISLSWNAQGNSTSTVYQVTYSTDNFVTNLATGVPFSAGLSSAAATITGLLTGTTYWVRIQAENPFGVLTQFSPSTTAFTNNGGVPAGSLGGVLTAIGKSSIQGNLGNGRSVLVRSPSGAFPSNVTLVISSYNATTPLCPNGLNVAFSLAQTPAFQPSLPLYFSASYAPAELGGFAPAQVALMRFEPVSGTCVPLATTFDATGLTFTSELNHFSLYELAGVPLASDLSAARIFPNPFRAARDAYVTIDRVPPGARVRVMTLRGEPVLDQTANGSGLLVWSATNGAGRSVASGLYLVLVDWAGARKVLKLAVIR